MFDVGFSELLVIAVVALLVLGPERLPKVARTAGHLLGRLQRYVNDVKADIHREMQLDELRKVQQQIEGSAREIETSVRKELTSVETDLNRSLESAVPAASTEPPAEAAAAVAAGQSWHQADVQAVAGEVAPQPAAGIGRAPAATAGKS